MVCCFALLCVSVLDVVITRISLMVLFVCSVQAADWQKGAGYVSVKEVIESLTTKESLNELDDNPKKFVEDLLNTSLPSYEEDAFTRELIKRTKTIAKHIKRGPCLDSMLEGYVALSFSPDGSRVALALNGIHIKDIQRNELINKFGGGIFMEKVVYSNDGSKLASTSSNHLYVWDPQSGDQLHKLEGQTQEIWALAFSPDASLLASACNDGQLFVWDLEGFGCYGCLLHRLDTPVTKRIKVSKYISESAESSESTYGAQAIAWSPDGAHLASGHYTGAVSIWDVQCGCLYQNLSDGHTEQIYALAFSPDGSKLASTCAGRIVCVWDIRMLRPLYKLCDSHAVCAVTWSPDGSQLASGSGGSVKIWSAYDGCFLRKLNTCAGDAGIVKLIMYKKDGSQLIVRSGCKKICTFDIPEHKKLAGLLTIARELHERNRMHKKQAEKQEHKEDDGKGLPPDVESPVRAQARSFLQVHQEETYEDTKDEGKELPSFAYTPESPRERIIRWCSVVLSYVCQC